MLRDVAWLTFPTRENDNEEPKKPMIGAYSSLMYLCISPRVRSCILLHTFRRCFSRQIFSLSLSRALDFMLRKERRLLVKLPNISRTKLFRFSMSGSAIIYHKQTVYGCVILNLCFTQITTGFQNGIQADILHLHLTLENHASSCSRNTAEGFWWKKNNLSWR